MRTFILCRNGLHEMNDANRASDNRCVECRKVTDAKKRERRRNNPALKARYEDAQARSKAWYAFHRAKKSTKKLEHAVRIVASGWASEAELTELATEVARSRRKFTPGFEDDPQARIARALLDITNGVANLSKAKQPSLGHLNVKPDAERAWDRFNKALEHAALTGENVPNCQGRPAEFVDFDEEDLPTAEEAYRLCYGCPLLELCATYAEQELPAWGVHAGEVWVAGEIVNNE